MGSDEVVASLVSETLSPDAATRAAAAGLEHERATGVLRRWLSGAGFPWTKADGQPEQSKSPLRGGLEMTTGGYAEIQRRISRLSAYQAGPAEESSLGLFNGRPIICDNSRINGSVYLCPRPVEAVVVDTRCGHLWGVLQELFRSRLPEGITQRSPGEILAAVFFLVREKLPLNEKKVAALLAEKQFMPDQKVSLEFFLSEGVGAPRHQVLLAAFLLERLCESLLLRGRFMIRHRKPLLDEVLIFRTEDNTEYTFVPGFTSNK